MEKSICAVCGESGGMFRYRPGKDDYVHTPGCDKSFVGTRDTARSTFPFTTSNMSSDGQPVTVQSMRHLRKLENAHGVGSVAYNMDRSNF